MNMNDHTQRILERMLSLLRGYREGDVSLTYLVGSLEGSLLTLEEKLPRTFYDTWYEHSKTARFWRYLGISSVIFPPPRL
jgi:hypothetical protein